MTQRRLTKWCALAAACCFVSVFAAEAMAKRDKEHREERYEEKGHRGKEKEERGHHNKRESYFRKHGHTRLRIPPGHYPPPGECRIWYPDRPAGHQPEHIKCGMVPPLGAWILHAPRHRNEYLNIRVYDPQRPDMMISIGEFNRSSGEFIRDLDADNDD